MAAWFAWTGPGISTAGGAGGFATDELLPRGAFLGSARASRAGDGAWPSRTFMLAKTTVAAGRKFVLARRQNRHARRVRSPERCYTRRYKRQLFLRLLQRSYFFGRAVDVGFPAAS
jgi:hypothetical protein